MVTRRILTLAALCLAATLAGCSFLGDLAEGQRISQERLVVADALRGLVGELASIEGVDAAAFDFDAADVESMPRLDVELASIDPGPWRRVISTIDDAASREPLSTHTVAVGLASGPVASGYDTEWGAEWLDVQALTTAGAFVDRLPGSRVWIGGAERGAHLTVAVPDAAEVLLTRLADDTALREVVEGADPERTAVELQAAGLSLSGAPPSSEAAAWARRVLAVDLDRLPPPLGSDDGIEVPDAWVAVSIGSGAATTVAVDLIGATEPASGPAWEALITLLTTPPPDAASGACTAVQITYSWPGVTGNWPTFSSACLGFEPWGDLDRASLVELREALAASGIDLEELGYTLW